MARDQWDQVSRKLASLQRQGLTPDEVARRLSEEVNEGSLGTPRLFTCAYVSGKYVFGFKRVAR